MTPFQGALVMAVAPYLGFAAPFVVVYIVARVLRARRRRRLLRKPIGQWDCEDVMAYLITERR